MCLTSVPERRSFYVWEAGGRNWIELLIPPSVTLQLPPPRGASKQRQEAGAVHALAANDDVSTPVWLMKSFARDSVCV